MQSYVTPARAIPPELPNGDKLSTLQYFITLSMQLGMIWVGQPLLNDGELNRTGSNSGAMAQVGPTSPAQDIPDGDLETAKRMGARVREVAAKLRGQLLSISNNVA